jgi:uncharacterized membrane protein YfcA
VQIYLPIAEISVNVFLILGMGGIVGFLSGLFGVGGGFLMTPLLIFIGVPPAVAVGTQANQLVASVGVRAIWPIGGAAMSTSAWAGAAVAAAPSAPSSASGCSAWLRGWARSTW